MIRLFAILTTIVVIASDLVACPRIDRKMIDFNCDQQYKVAVVGDSIVKGVDGDSLDPFYDGDGGYVARLEAQTGYTFSNIGIRGIRSDQLLRDFKRNINKKLTSKLLKDADIVIIDVGRNDFWNSPLEQITLPTVRNIKRIVSFLKKVYQKRDSKVVPYFMVATLIPTTRTNIHELDLQLFVDDLNQNLRRFKSRGLPVELFFDEEFDINILGADLLHPSSTGYQEIADFLETDLRGRVNKILKSKRKDLDRDKIYDIFETWFGMDPTNPDTNGDGILDGNEVFVQSLDESDNFK